VTGAISTHNALDHLTQWQKGLDYKNYTYDPRGNLLEVNGVTGMADPTMAIADLLSNPEAADPEHGVTDSVYLDSEGPIEPNAPNVPNVPNVPVDNFSVMSEPSAP
jgi:hypothetical protein